MPALTRDVKRLEVVGWRVTSQHQVILHSLTNLRGNSRVDLEARHGVVLDTEDDLHFIQTALLDDQGGLLGVFDILVVFELQGGWSWVVLEDDRELFDNQAARVVLRSDVFWVDTCLIG